MLWSRELTSVTIWRIQPVVATLSCWGERRCSSRASGWGLPVEGLSGPAVECCGDRVEVASGVSGEVCAFGEVLAQQAVGVLVGAALPGAVGVTEVDVEVGIDSQLGVLGHLRALVPGQRAAQLLGQRGDRRGDGVAHGLGAVPGQGRAILDSGHLAVAGHGGQVQQHREAGAALDEGADGLSGPVR